MSRAGKEVVMFEKKPTALARTGVFIDPFAFLARMAPEFERFFDEPAWPAFRARGATGGAAWTPHVDVFEKDNRLIARVDLPGLKKEDVKVEIAEGYLTISGARRWKEEEKKENYYKCEREYGTFYRAIPLPDGVTFDAVKATFDSGVLEVSIPLAAGTASKPFTVSIEPAPTPAKAA
jgi:HSP20 family protein